MDPHLVAEAEKEELEFMERLGVGVECDIEECWSRSGKPHIPATYARVNKGSPSEPDVRARLCGRDFKIKGDNNRIDLFASMPPLEAKKLLFRQAVRSRKQWGITSGSG